VSVRSSLPLAALLIGLTASPAAAESGWLPTGPIHHERVNSAGLQLADGRVLLVGGSIGSAYPAETELYDPATGRWTDTGALNAPRTVARLVRLDDGRVLLLGGLNGSAVLDSVETYDPTSGSWTTTAPMTQRRRDLSATLLQDGRVLVTGGSGPSGPVSTAELYDPTDDSWTAIASMGAARANQIQVLLADGRVLVAGGRGGGSTYLSSAEVFDPDTELFTPTASMSIGRVQAGAARLANGRVLVSGGANPGTISSSEVYDPDAETWSPAGSLPTPGDDAFVSVAPDGEVHVVTTKVLSPTTMTIAGSAAVSFTDAGTVMQARPTVIPLSDGRSLLAGGLETGGPSAVTASWIWRASTPVATPEGEAATGTGTPVPTPAPAEAPAPAAAVPAPVAPTAVPVPDCQAVRTFTLPRGVARSMRWAVARLDGQRVARLTQRRRTVRVSVAGAHARTYVLRVRVKPDRGPSRVVVRRYVGCATRG
jgi:hypothetical protein